MQKDNFEVIVVEDGSSISSETVCRTFQKELPLKYVTQKNHGPGVARNTGAQHAKGNWLIFLDSDTTLPHNYLDIVDADINNSDFDCYGGPDKADHNFNTVQKAIGYSMSSILTTGGIRGAKEKLDIFYPRTYNLGVKREIFLSLNGFSDMRFGEDLDFSMRLIEKGFKTKLLKQAFVFHKRRNNFISFFKQVNNFGAARINLEKRHPGTMKIVHCFPAIFVVCHLLVILFSILYPVCLFTLTIIPVVIFTDALIKTKEIKTALFAVVATFVQMFGYGTGFIKAVISG
jgi:glycosyltransferase involved in cell wall biosynthesis